MKKKWVGPLLRYGLTALLAALMTLAVLELHGFAQAATQADRYRILCDAFTIPGVILLMLGLLVWISDMGTFDGLSYSLRYAFRRLFFVGGAKTETYYDYKEQKKERRRQRSGYSFLLVVGGVFLAVAIVFMILFYRL